MSLVTLVSGGMDSTLMSILTKEQGIEQFPLFIDYGQICVEQEWNACETLMKKHDLPPPTRVNLNGFGELIKSGLTNNELRVNEDAFTPGRNLLFLLIGAAYAYQKDAKGVAIGLLSEKYHLFPDQTKEFIMSAEKMLTATMDMPINIVAPLMDFSKADIIKLCKDKEITGTYSCHSGGLTPCGKCISCKEIIEAEKVI